MDRITLKNLRCFRDEQTDRLAPLTLPVGKNSIGKTSFPHKRLLRRTNVCRT